MFAPMALWVVAAVAAIHIDMWIARAQALAGDQCRCKCPVATATSATVAIASVLQRLQRTEGADV